MTNGKTELELVTLSTTIRPVFGRTHFTNKNGENWKMWLHANTVHVEDQSARKFGHAILHLSACTVLAKTKVVPAAKPKAKVVAKPKSEAPEQPKTRTRGKAKE